MVKAGDHAEPVADPRGDLECFPQVRPGLGHVTRLPIQFRHKIQAERLIAQVACLPGPGQSVRAAALGGSHLAGLDQRHSHDLTRQSCESAGDSCRVNLLGLLPPGQRRLEIVEVGGREAQRHKGQRFAGRVADFSGKGQGTAGIIGRLRDAAGIQQGQ